MSEATRTITLTESNYKLLLEVLAQHQDMCDIAHGNASVAGEELEAGHFEERASNSGMLLAEVQTDYLPYASLVERQIVTKLLDRALEAGYLITVKDGEEVVIVKSDDRARILRNMNSTDQDVLTFFKDGKRLGWIQLIWGNEEDLISDTSMGDEIEALAKL